MIELPAPPSKSISHRMLMAAALAEGRSVVSNVLESDDIARTVELLGLFGAQCERQAPGTYAVRGVNGQIRGSAGLPAKDVYVGESGTTCRFGMALLSAGTGLFRLHGSGRMQERPMGELARAVSSLGAQVTFEGEEGCLPLVLQAKGFSSEQGAGGTPSVVISCDASSQYLSGLLMAAPLGSASGLRIALQGERIVSWPYVALTLATLELFGIAFSVKTLVEGEWKEADWQSMRRTSPKSIRFRVFGGSYLAGRYTVEGDWTSAAYFLAAGAVGQTPVKMLGLNPDSMQADMECKGILRRMGARVEEDGTGITVYPSRLRGVKVHMGDCPDLVPTVAALAYHAEGPTEIRGASQLPLKESNRITAPAEELRKAGCTVEELLDGLRIFPPATALQGNVRNRTFSSHGDHRLAMSLSLLGIGAGANDTPFVPDIDDAACVSKSFPEFWTLWEKATGAKNPC
ncbi:3-phosphoshikimate 1-carboxyvinyltransferase [Desulfovibrio sp. OttesenSCG-928-G15]|nr:3-phosphoshikimate 1-carboxyvinyltransferase [Desulfovibrio sp. OttesenSCG-928-G15]